MFQSGLLVFVSIEVQGKLPDLRYISVGPPLNLGSSLNTINLSEFERNAVEFLRENDTKNESAEYKVVGSHQYEDMVEFNKLVKRITKRTIISKGNRIERFNIHGESVEMELSDFNGAFSEDTNHQRLTFGRPGTFKMLYSPSVDHESMCYYPNLKKGEIMQVSMIKDLGMIYPKKVPILVKLQFKFKCWLSPIQSLITRAVLVEITKSHEVSPNEKL